MVKQRMPVVAAFFCAVLGLTACGTPKQDKSLDHTLNQYEQVIRWSQWDAALDFLAPEYMIENPITTLDMDRLRLFRVTGYIGRSRIAIEGGMAVMQVVELRLFNRNRAVEQRIIDQQLWRYHPKEERWMLHSGLPDPTQRN